MPVLSNARHERFAQALASGKTADESYSEAGFSANRGNATRMKANESVIARVAELQGKAAERSRVTVESLTDDLVRIARKAEQLEDAPGLAVAKAAKMDIAKLNGLVIERAENMNVHHVIASEPATAAEWAEEHVTAH